MEAISLLFVAVSLALVVTGVALFLIDAFIEGVGPLGGLGLVVALLGGAMWLPPLLRPGPSLGFGNLSSWLFAASGAVVAGLAVVMAIGVYRSHRMPVRSGAQALQGERAVALTDLAPRGTVKVGTEPWSATTLGEKIHRGETVRVLDLEGVTLTVRREALVSETGERHVD